MIDDMVQSDMDYLELLPRLLVLLKLVNEFLVLLAFELEVISIPDRIYL